MGNEVRRVGRARWSGSIPKGSGSISADSGAFMDLKFTFASRTSSRAELTDPEELLASAHAACFAMSLASVIGESGLVPSDIAVSAEVTLEPTTSGRRITRSALDVEVTALPAGNQEWLDEKVALADARCPFSALIRASGQVTVSAAIRLG